MRRDATYLANRVQPRLFMTTHMPFDPYLNEKAVAEVREHWKGPYHFGALDGVVVNVTKESIWVREGIPTTRTAAPPSSTLRAASSWSRIHRSHAKTSKSRSFGSKRSTQGTTTHVSTTQTS